MTSRNTTQAAAMKKELAYAMRGLMAQIEAAISSETPDNYAVAGSMSAALTSLADAADMLGSSAANTRALFNLRAY